MQSLMESAAAISSLVSINVIMINGVVRNENA